MPSILSSPCNMQFSTWNTMLSLTFRCWYDFLLRTCLLPLPGQWGACIGQGFFWDVSERSTGNSESSGPQKQPDSVCPSHPLPISVLRCHQLQKPTVEWVGTDVPLAPSQQNPGLLQWNRRSWEELKWTVKDNCGIQVHPTTQPSLWSTPWWKLSSKGTVQVCLFTAEWNFVSFNLSEFWELGTSGQFKIRFRIQNVLDKKKFCIWRLIDWLHGNWIRANTLTEMICVLPHPLEKQINDWIVVWVFLVCYTPWS